MSGEKKVEPLTENERLSLRVTDPRALEIIDDHAADRAALVAQVAELTRERDEAREASATRLAYSEQYRTQLSEARKLLEETTDDALKERVEFWRQASEAAEAQAQRDHELAAEWKATAEAYRVDAEVTRDRLAALRGRVDTARRAWWVGTTDNAAFHVALLEALRG